MIPPGDRRVLIVDDEPHLRIMLSRFLSKAGWACAAAATRAETLDLLGREAFTHAVIDIHLGLESGLDVIRDVKARLPGARVLAMTGAVLGGPEAALLAGADAFLTKPVPRLARVAQALEGAASDEN